MSPTTDAFGNPVSSQQPGCVCVLGQLGHPQGGLLWSVCSLVLLTEAEEKMAGGWQLGSGHYITLCSLPCQDLLPDLLDKQQEGRPGPFLNARHFLLLPITLLWGPSTGCFFAS